MAGSGSDDDNDDDDNDDDDDDNDDDDGAGPLSKMWLVKNISNFTCVNFGRTIAMKPVIIHRHCFLKIRKRKI